MQEAKLLNENPEHKTALEGHHNQNIIFTLIGCSLYPLSTSKLIKKNNIAVYTPNAITLTKQMRENKPNVQME